MANDLLHGLIRANLAGTAVALILLAARGSLRKLIGPTAVYALWLAVPAAGLASLLPSRTVVTILQSAALGQGAIPAAASTGAADQLDWPLLMIAAWAAGVAVATASITWRHYRFLATLGRLETKDGIAKAVGSNAGPAVIGLISPRILVPGDFETRFSPRERSVILAHETIHLARGDSRINAAVLMVQCFNWFNPIAHIAARAVRLDQELACDAGVMRQFPMARRSYAEAMLKSQTDPITLPVGCYWQAKGASALSNRLTLLNAKPLSRTQMTAGLTVALLLTSGAGVSGWMAQPARQVVVVEPPPQTPVAVLSGLTGAATASRSLPVATPSLRHSKADGVLKAAGKPEPDALAPAIDNLLKNRARLQSVRWSSMPMPPELADSDDNPSSGSDASAAYDKVANARNQVQTVSTYRSGAYQMKSNFIPVGDQIRVSTELYKSGDLIGAGTATIRPGEVAYVELSNGQLAQVEPGKTAYLITTAATPPWAKVPSAPS